jgi:hypothetical protein
VVHPATDQGTDYTADGTANRGGDGDYDALRRLVAGQRGDAAS